MKAGKLRWQYALQALVAGSPSQKASGEPDVDWATSATVWGSEPRPLTGREFFNAQQAGSRVEVEIELRYRENVTGAMRLLRDSVVYSIERVMQYPKEGRTVLGCSTGVNQG